MTTMITGMDEAQAALRALPPMVQVKASKFALRKTAQPVAKELRNAAPGSRSGRIAKSIGYRVISDSRKPYYGATRDQQVAHIGPTKKVAIQVGTAGGIPVVKKQSVAHIVRFTDEGTKAHEIPNPKSYAQFKSRGKYLRWKTGGGFMFRKRVQHPGIRGDHWMQRTYDRIGPKSADYFFGGLSEYLDKNLP